MSRFTNSRQSKNEERPSVPMFASSQLEQKAPLKVFMDDQGRMIDESGNIMNI